jgi:heat shock protein HspQ
MTQQAIVAVGQLIKHKLFHYRGVVVDVDPVFMQSEEWYERVARSHPPKDEPWYRVLVHDSFQETYVAQRNLEPDQSGEPINHPAIGDHFIGFLEGRYITSRRAN